jgi:Sugar (and other) transporter
MFLRFEGEILLIWPNSTTACAVCMCVFAAVALPLTRTGTLSHSRAQTSIAFYYLFNVVYGFTYTPLQGVIPAEALETTTRAKGLALSGFVVSLIGFINQFASPIGLQNLKTNYIWIFVGWDVFESACWYLFW